MKKILSLIILTAFMLSLCACTADLGKPEEKAKEVNGKVEETSDTDKVEKFEFKHEYDQGKEYGILQALDENGEIVWEYSTDKYGATEHDRVIDMGENGGHYYLVVDGTVVCLNKSTGKKEWEQGSVGAANTFCFGKNGELYVTGILGPEATKIDKNGKIIWTVKDYEGYQWPYGISLIDDNTLEIKMTAETGESDVPVRVDAKSGKLLASASSGQSTNDLFSRVAGNYTFASGAGGWSTDIVLLSDGTFTGDYHDNEYADDGKGYTSILYLSKFHGKFSNVKKISEYSYTADLVSLTYDSKKGKEEISDGIKTCYVDAYGFEKCKSVTFYLKGAKMKDLPSDFITWGYGSVGISGKEDTLPTNGFYNIADSAGFFDTKNAFSF